MAYLEFNNISKIYQGEEHNRAVNQVNFSIQKGEFVVFVGPSGCGKSTFLRMIAGLEEISEGEMVLDGRVLNDVEVKDRDVSMVFQDYALYPHMTVLENLSFGLKNIKMKKKAIKEKTDLAIQLLKLNDLQHRYPKQLSGGQRQRVALGRAIVKEPKVFLLDEPLSNLDSKLRVHTRKMIAELHRKLDSTMIYVTHDQIEAMTLGDKIVVMNRGEIQQIDTPENIYLNPQNMFVASFIGTPSMNLIQASVNEEGDLFFGNHTIHLPNKDKRQLIQHGKKEVVLGIRPEHIELKQAEESLQESHQPTFVEFLGSENLLYFEIDGKDIVVKIPVQYKMSEKEYYLLSMNKEKICVFDQKSTKRII